MASHSPTQKRLHSQRTGHWLPKDRKLIQTWLSKLVKRVKEAEDIPLDQTLVDFKKVVESDPELKKLATNMLTEVPEDYEEDPYGQSEVRDFDHMLELINHVIRNGPEFMDPKDHSATAMGLIGFPINAILDWPTGTKSGYIFWLLPVVNKAFFPVLDTWSKFLASRESQKCLEPSKGWTSKDALTLLAQHGDNDNEGLAFEQLYHCNSKDLYLGFHSWDAFFTRDFNQGMRPVIPSDEQPTDQYPDPTKVIVHSCESAPLRLVSDVGYYATFWLKEQPYSLIEMLDRHTLAHLFIGGTVYQAFLSALSYHKWHAPVSGKVVDIKMVSGTYYCQNYFEGFANPAGPDPSAPNNSQAFLSAVAARGIIFIEADNQDIGLMAIVYIGMAEVSSCEFKVKTGQTIKKGDEIGTFHFGGSTHCMLFRPQTKLQPLDPGPWDLNSSKNVKVRSPFAVVMNSR